VDLDVKGLSYALGNALESLMERLQESPRDAELLRRVEATVSLAGSTPFTVDLGQTQNRYYELLRTVFPDQSEKSGDGDAEAAEWVCRFRKLGERLAVRVG